MQTFIVIPAYNEENRISQVIEQLLDFDYKIVIVDDNSQDKTSEIIKKYPVFHAKHSANLGQGAALRTGTEIALQNNADIIVHFDADGQHRVDDLENIIQTLKKTNLDLVLGSRFMEIESEIPKKKQIILSLAKFFTNKLLKLNFTDPQSGLRGFKSHVFKKINWQNDDYMHCTEILGLIKKNKVHYQEIPIKINYNEHSVSKKVKPRMSMGLKILFYKLFY